MSTAERTQPIPPDMRELHNGDRMDAETFHRIYLEMPDNFKAELIGGVVYVASPLGLRHAETDGYLGALVMTYAGMTPGTQGGHGATVRLGEAVEVQPDLFLRILPECGGQSRTEDNFVVGAPELIAEVAHTSWSIDMGRKYEDYRRNGVRDYLVLDLHDRQFRWFDLTVDQELRADADGVMRIRRFRGLWLNAAAILGGDFPAMRATLEAGMASAEYKEFAAQLSAERNS
jgi:Uma2 family endonuclease